MKLNIDLIEISTKKIEGRGKKHNKFRKSPLKTIGMSVISFELPFSFALLSQWSELVIIFCQGIQTSSYC